jgi:F-type H+-transporting ATPase subunit delta
MILSGIGKRYAVALFNVANKEDIAEQVSGDIISFNKLHETNADFRHFLESPRVTGAAKKQLLMSVIGDRASGLFVRFVMLLLDKKRLNFVEAICDAYTFLYEEQQGIMEVKCVTAIELDQDLMTKTRLMIESKADKKVRLVTMTDPRIIGGMILFTKDRIIDGSIRSQLHDMRKDLSELKVH